MNSIEYTDFIMHHGIKGQRWGIRRFQNEDGSLTEAGKKRYAKELKKEIDSASKITSDGDKAGNKKNYFGASAKLREMYGDKIKNSIPQKDIDSLLSAGNKMYKAFDDEDKFDDAFRKSDENKKLYNDSYKYVLNNFEKWHGKETFDAMIKENGGSYEDLDKFRIFDNELGYAIDNRRASAERAFSKRTGIKRVDISKAIDAHKNACQKIASDMLGKYADVPVKGLDYGKYLKSDYKNVLAEMLSDMTLEDLRKY